MKMLRTTVPVLALAALAAAGCFLVSGQFVVSYNLPSPVTFNTTGTFQGELVDLNTISDYSDHKTELKRVDDLALVGKFTNNGASSVQVEAWIAPNATSDPTAPVVGAVKLWGPLTVASGATVNVDWNQSSSLFVGRQTLIDEIKGDGVFGLYLTAASSPYNVTVTDGALIAVIGAAK